MEMNGCSVMTYPMTTGRLSDLCGAAQMLLLSDFAHRVFDGVVNDQVVVPKRKPRSHGHKVSVLQGDWTSPCTQNKA